MKRIILSILTLCALSAYAQSEIKTYSVYDVNHDAAVTVEDVTKVVNRAVKSADDNQQTVEVDELKALLRSIDNRLAKLEEKMGVGEGSAGNDVKDEHEWVDLGLPSGTLWATCNVGANSPEEYGDYFAWGEVLPKRWYAGETYKYALSTKWPPKYSKYVMNSKFGTVDGKIDLESEDDAATFNWGDKWKTPSVYQIDELIDSRYTKSSVISINGVNGCKIESLSNKNSIFLPFAGTYFDGNNLGNAGYACGYLSCSLYLGGSDFENGPFYDPIDEGTDTTCAHILIVSDYRVFRCFMSREEGHPVRPVRK